MKLIITILLLTLSTIALADNDLCIGINNFSTQPIVVSGINSDEEYTIQPKRKLILPSNELTKTCFKDWGCDISIIESNDQAKQASSRSSTLIKKVARGSRIIYGAQNLYYINNKAEVPCVNDDIADTAAIN